MLIFKKFKILNQKQYKNVIVFDHPLITHKITQLRKVETSTHKFRPLVKNDLILAVNKIRGSLSNKIIGELMKWNEQFGGI